MMDGKLHGSHNFSASIILYDKKKKNRCVNDTNKVSIWNVKLKVD